MGEEDCAVPEADLLDREFQGPGFLGLEWGWDPTSPQSQRFPVLWAGVQLKESQSGAL